MLESGLDSYGAKETTVKETTQEEDVDTWSAWSR